MASRAKYLLVAVVIIACSPTCGPIAGIKDCTGWPVGLTWPIWPTERPHREEVLMFFIDRAYAPFDHERESYSLGELQAKSKRLLNGVLPRLALSAGDGLLIRLISSDSRRPDEEIFPLTYIPTVQKPSSASETPRPTPAPRGGTACSEDFQRLDGWRKDADAKRDRDQRNIHTDYWPWSDSQHRAAETVVAKALAQLNGFEIQPDFVRTDIWGALQVAGKTLAQTPDARGWVVLFSDLADASTPPDDVDLHGASVVVALYRRAASGQEGPAEAQWRSNLVERAKAGQVWFISEPATTADTIAAALPVGR